jgi:hypothetical protein
LNRVPFGKFNRVNVLILGGLSAMRDVAEEVSYEDRQKVAEVIERICRKENINPQKLRRGSRRRRICQVRAQMIYQLIEILGISLAEVARQVEVSKFAISEALDRKMKDQFNSVNNVLQFSLNKFQSTPPRGGRRRGRYLS